MPSTTTNSTRQHHSALSRVRGWRPLAKASAAVGAAAAVTAGAAATNADIFVLQDESNTTNLSQYVSLYNSTSAQARAANSGVLVYSEVSTANGTADQMTAAARSISPDGFYVAAPGATAQADQFFLNMKAAGD